MKWGVFLIKKKLYFTDMFNISFARYRMLFSSENMYGIFRANVFSTGIYDSSGFDLTCVKSYNGNSTEDLLNDVRYFSKAGNISLKINDIICIKLNGCVVSYRFCGVNRWMDKQHEYNYSEVKDFYGNEKIRYIDCLHKEGLTLNVPDGRLYSLDELVDGRHKIYCIDKEVFKPVEMGGIIVSDYSVLMLKGNSIVNANPHSQPFVMISNALYFFNSSLGNDSGTVLLLDKGELELVRDFRELRREKLVL
jgi:hypothetical protein